MEDEYVFVIDSSGVEFIHDDNLNQFRKELSAPFVISRAGNVNYDNHRRGFRVHIPGVGFLAWAYDRRADAIQAEVAYLHEQMREGRKISQIHRKDK